MDSRKKESIFRLCDRAAPLEKEDMAFIIKEGVPFAEEFQEAINDYVG
jgi:hypothetical protein